MQEHVHASHRREASAIQAPEIPEPRAFKELNVLSGTFTDRLVEVAGGRPIVVTLSGGYDSRYIAAQLKLRGHENVMLITYGRSDSIDVATARRVADRLGYRWEFVEYTNSTMRKVGASDWFVDYMRRAGGGSATAHAQDAAALRQLLERGILDPTSLIVPGFCGDLLGGSCIPPGSTTVAGNSQYEREGLAAYALRTQAYFRNPVDPHELVELQRSIATEVQSVGPFWHDQETWFATTKVPNYVCNAVRLYDYLGLAWWLPLWDRSLVEWWHKVPPAQLARKHLYDHYLASEVFEPLGIAFNTPHNWLHRASVAQLRRRVPPSLQRAARRTYYGARRVRGVSYDNLNNFATLTESLMAATGVSYHRPVRDDIDVLSALANWTVGIG